MRMQQQHTENPVAARRAVLVEDDAEFQIVLCQALDNVPGIWRVNGFSLGQDAVAFLNAFSGQIDLILLDLGLPDVDGTQVLAAARRRFPEVPILIVTVVASEDKLLQAVRLGATGYVLKDEDAIDIASSIGHALRGNFPISPLLARCLIRSMPAPSEPCESPFALSNREEQLLRYITLGYSYARAADEMGLKVSTLHSYSRTLFRKLGVHSQTQAAAHARRHGMVSS
jgi:DNA-binding NarL/FixJ family response regulator